MSKPKEAQNVSSEFVKHITALIEDDQADMLTMLLKDFHPVDIAQIVRYLDDAEKRYLFKLLDVEVAHDTITEIDEDSREAIIKALSDKQIIDLVDEMESDDAADILSELSEEVVNRVLSQIDEETSTEVKQLLEYEEDTAGGLMGVEYITVFENQNVEQAIEIIRLESKEVEQVYNVYVVDERNVLKGIVSLKSLVLADPKTPISKLMNSEIVYVTVDVDQEVVAQLFSKYDFVSMPVVDEDKRLVGRITIDDIVDVIEEEAHEDINRMAGTVDEEVGETSVYKVTKARLPWLIVGLGGELLAGIIMMSFEVELRKIIALTFFIPVIIAVAGSTAIQSSSIVIRGLAKGEIEIGGLWRRIFRETRVSLIIGILLGISLGFIAYFWIDENILAAMAVGSSLVLVVFVASLSGTLIPLMLRTFNIDPAMAAGPFITTFNDTVGLLIYLGVTSMILF